jgi:transcriptional regulator with XRE-family HTH domain
MREYREKAGLSLDQVAEILSVAKTSLVNAELYGRSLGKRKIYQLADLYNVDPRILEGYM